MRYLGKWNEFDDPAFDAFTDAMIEECTDKNEPWTDQERDICKEWCESHGVKLIKFSDDTDEYQFLYEFYVVDEDRFLLWLITASIKTKKISRA